MCGTAAAELVVLQPFTRFNEQKPPDVTHGLALHHRSSNSILTHFLLCRKGSPAFAIALAGGYADDDDTGAEFWYNLVPRLEQSSHNTGH